MKQKTSYKKVLYILLFAIVLALVYNIFSIDGIDFVKKESKIDMLKSIDVTGVADTNKSLKAITLAQAIQLYSKENVIFVDARDKWEFSDGHIKGAINIPEYSFDSNITDVSTLSKENIIIVYCSEEDCNLSKKLTEQFLILGFNKTYVFLGGITEWKEAELPIETSVLK